eukprot:2965266-Karenia_brevis.AAC.1
MLSHLVLEEIWLLVGGLEGHVGFKLKILGSILAPSWNLAPRLETLRQLDYLKKQLGHLRRHWEPKIGHTMPFSGGGTVKNSRRELELDHRGRGRGRGIWQKKKKLGL